MKQKTIQLLSESKFRRVVGVKRATFNTMVSIVEEEHKKKKSKGGRPNKVNIYDMVLMTLEYLREYRTYATIGVSYGLSESSAYKTIRWVENTLVQCGLFSLPGKKVLLQSNNTMEVVLIDATESPIERPKKNNANFTLGKRSDIQ